MLRCNALAAIFKASLVLALARSAMADVALQDGRLVYQSDQHGNRVPDFAQAGYRGGEVSIPTVPARVLLGKPAEDNTRALQSAIDQVAQLPLDQHGFRGAVLIPPGFYPILGSLRLGVSGVVLRGSGAHSDGTTLLATGIDRRSVVQVLGQPTQAAGKPRAIVQAYVPAGALTIRVEEADGLSVGDHVHLTHPCTKEWIAALGMHDFGGDRHGPSWRPGSRDIHWMRTITKIEGNEVTIDVALTLALDASLARCTLTKLDCQGLVRNVGIENLRIASTFDSKNPKDEEHAWHGVAIEHARDVWVRRVTCEHLVGSAVAAWETASRVTVEDCKNLQPVGEIGGWRRCSFFTNGQQVLMQRLYSEQGWHDFAVGSTAAGPNAFVQCESFESLGESGAIDSAACGTLFDRVRIDGQPLGLRNRSYQGLGVGWASLNGVLWNCSAALIANEKPPTAQNWAFGAHGEFTGNGTWISSDDGVNPQSLYYAQLGERIGNEPASHRALLYRPPVQGSRAPTLESAAQAIEVSLNPRVDMNQWIDHVVGEHPLDVAVDGIPAAQPMIPALVDRVPTRSIAITNGWITVDGSLAIGGEASVPWWNGGVRPDDLAKASPAVTRFVPGRSGKGWTDDLNEVSEEMVQRGQTSLWQHPPLWYDRRRDDHSRVKRMDGDVVAPFYETPWARSGTGVAYDGLSKWDLNRINPWYFGRLRQFARLGAQRGHILWNGLYMQHSLLEAGAHYVDAPWRPANNINSTGLPEPVFFAGDKLIYVAQQFYDVAHPDRARLHRTYMRNALSELAGEPNVIFFLSEEYTGPLEFTRFWLDVVSEWKSETNRSVLIALFATKDVTDAVLEDPVRSRLVSLIYNRSSGDGWWYQPDGSLYAPQGGKNLAPRQWARLLKPKNTNFQGVLAAAREYRLRYPDKPFVYRGTEPWGLVLGGGSLPELPKTTDPELLRAIVRMRPIPESRVPVEGIGLSDDAGNRLIYVDTRPSGPNVYPISTRTGQVTQEATQFFWIKVSP